MTPSRTAGTPRYWAGGRSAPHAPGCASLLLQPLPTDGFRVLLFALIVFMLGRVHEFVPGLAAIDPVLILVLFAGGFLALRPNTANYRQAVGSWPGRVMLALLVLAIVGAPFGIHAWGSLSVAIKQYAKILVVPFLVIVAIRDSRDLYSFVWAHVVAAGFLAATAVLVVEMQMLGGVARLVDMGMYDSNDLGCVLATGIPLVVFAWDVARTRTGRLMAGTILLGSAVGLARSGSRGGFVGLVVVGAALLWTMRHVAPWKRIGVILVGAAGLFFAAPEGYWDRMETITEPTEDYNWTDYYGRRQVALRGIDYMLENPVFGVGMGNFPRADAMLAAEADIAGHQKWRAPHNSYVQIGSELGVTGLLLWSSLVFGGMFSLVRIRRRLPRSWLRGGHERRFLYLFAVYMPVTLLGFAVTSFFLSFAYLVPVYLLAALLVGYYVSLRNGPTGAAPAATRQGRGRGAAVPR